MATTIAGVAMAGGGGFVLKSVREVRLETQNAQTFSVQNEGDFCIIARKLIGSGYDFNISKIDDIPVNITTTATDIVFGKNIVVKSSGSRSDCHIFEYGPAE